MTKHFVIATDDLSVEEEKALKDELSGVGWWHWLPNFWLVKDSAEQFSAREIRAAVKRVNRQARCLVLDVEPNTWAAATRKDSKGRDMAKWLNDTWC